MATKQKRFPQHARTEALFEAATAHARARVGEGVSHADIAKEFGISPATFKRWHGPLLSREDRYPPARRRQVERMATLGFSHQLIADSLEICTDTLKENFKKELTAGRVASAEPVLETYAQMLQSGEHPRLIEFYLKSQLGYRDRDEPQTAVQVNSVGGPVQVTLGGRALRRGDDGVVVLEDED